jgi:hypothetical protein
MFPTGFKVGAPGALLVVVAFFLPWVLVSCGNETPKLQSGWDVAIGTASTEPGYHGNPFVFLILLAGLAVLAMTYFAFRRGHVAPSDGIGMIGMGVVALAYLYLQFGRPSEGVTMEYQYGIWATVVGLVLIVAGGLLNFFELRNTTTNQLQR